MQITERFPEGANYREIEQTINNRTALEEVLNQEIFIKGVFSPYKPSISEYLGKEVITKTLIEFPDKFLDLSPECFINSIFKLGDEWDTLSKEIKERVIKQILSSTKIVASKGYPRFNISLDNYSFLLRIKKELAAKIIKKLVSCCNPTISGEFLSILGLLPLQPFKGVIDNSIIDYGGGTEQKDFDQLPEEYRQLLLEAIVDGRARGFAEILASKNVKKDFLDKNASELVEHLKKHHDTWHLQGILEAKSAKFKKEPSRFALLASLEESRCVQYLALDTLEEYVRNLKPMQKTLWANLLRNENIVKISPLLTQALKAYCNLKRPHIPLPLTIPDNIIPKLSPKQLASLIERSIDEKGNFRHLRYNPELMAQGLSSVAISQPVYYKQRIAGKLSLALEKYRTGESTCERICRYLNLDIDNLHYQIMHSNQGNLERAIRQAISAETTNERYVYVSFIVDMLKGKAFTKIQAKYRELLSEIENGSLKDTEKSKKEVK